MGRRRHCQSRELYIFSVEKETKIVNWELFFCTLQNIIGNEGSRVC